MDFLSVSCLCLFDFLLGGNPDFNTLEVPHHDLAVDGSRDDDAGVLGVELEGHDFQGRREDQQRVNGMHVFIVPEQDD